MNVECQKEGSLSIYVVDADDDSIVSAFMYTKKAAKVRICPPRITLALTPVNI